MKAPKPINPTDRLAVIESALKATAIRIFKLDEIPLSQLDASPEELRIVTDYRSVLVDIYRHFQRLRKLLCGDFDSYDESLADIDAAILRDQQRLREATTSVYDLGNTLIRRFLAKESGVKQQ